MNEHLTYSADLTVMSCWCGTRHAVPEELRDFQLREHQNGRSRGIYCPLGHSYVLAGDGLAKQLEQQLIRERAAHDQTKASLVSKEKQLHRVAHGVCPHCHRSFTNLRRHMNSKHQSSDSKAKVSAS